MNEGGIPLDYGDLPVEGTILNESEVYQCELTKVALALKRDKNNHMYCAVEVVVADGPYEGKILNRNYLRLPIPPRSNDQKDVLRAKDQNEQFGRFARCFKITGVPPELKFGDAESYARWQDWMSQFYGNQGPCTVRNEVYQGRETSRLNDFIV